MAGKILNTKIAVAVDEETRWAASGRKLLDGELAVSYRNVYDPDLGRNRKDNFQIRIGRRLQDGNLCTWSEAARLAVSDISPEATEVIYERVAQELSSKIVFKEQYDELVQQMSDQLSELSSMVGAKFEAGVKDETLLLYNDYDKENDPFVAGAIGG